MAFIPDGIAPPGIPLLGCSPPTTMRYRTFFGGEHPAMQSSKRTLHSIAKNLDTLDSRYE